MLNTIFLMLAKQPRSQANANQPDDCAGDGAQDQRAGQAGKQGNAASENGREAFFKCRAAGLRVLEGISEGAVRQRSPNRADSALPVLRPQDR